MDLAGMMILSTLFNDIVSIKKSLTLHPTILSIVEIGNIYIKIISIRIIKTLTLDLDPASKTMVIVSYFLL